MNEEITKIIVEAIASIAMVLITGYLIPWIKSKIGEEKYNRFVDYVELSVRSAEQLYSPEEWNKKKEYVRKSAIALLDSIGLTISETELENIIEGLVNEVKH